MPPNKEEGAGPLDKKDKGKTRTLKRGEKAENELHEQTKKLKEMDLLHMGRAELSTDADKALEKLGKDQDNRHGRAGDVTQEFSAQQRTAEEDPGFIVTFIQWMIAKEEKAPMPWTISRRDEIDAYLMTRDYGPYAMISVLAGPSFWYNRIRRKKVDYVGDRDPFNQDKEKRGVCSWPDPPEGGGESYHGMWRADQPHGFGVFRWFDGDRYIGAWNSGELEGYGVYHYSSIGAHPNDRYEGAYHKGIRQGSGVYRYGKNNEGGVYMGEWLQGKMNGCGFMLYPDGEHYIGDWKKDLKHGIGLYVWGPGSGDVSGDKYEGQFQDGKASGMGRTVFSDGGWHKGNYFDGQMHGWGVMRTADGYEYVGQWRNDEMNGEFVSVMSYGMQEEKEIQEYAGGDLIGQRSYNTGKDWAELEAVGLQAATDANSFADQGRAHVPLVTERAKRAKLSQTMARSAADEAKYYCKAAMKYRDFKRAWYGLKQYFILGEG